MLLTKMGRNKFEELEKLEKMVSSAWDMWSLSYL